MATALGKQISNSEAVIKKLALGKASAKIFFLGRRGSGKSTLAHMLADSIGARTISFSIAQPIYDRATEILGRTPDHALDRDVLIGIGNQMRQQDVLTLPRAAELEANKFLQNGGAVILDSVRLKSEVEFLLVHGWIGFKITRPQEARIETLVLRGEDMNLDNDPTESEVDFDYPGVQEVVNNHTLDAALEQLKRLLNTENLQSAYRQNLPAAVLGRIAEAKAEEMLHILGYAPYPPAVDTGVDFLIVSQSGITYSLQVKSGVAKQPNAPLMVPLSKPLVRNLQNPNYLLFFLVLNPFKFGFEVQDLFVVPSDVLNAARRHRVRGPLIVNQFEAYRISALPDLRAILEGGNLK